MFSFFFIQTRCVESSDRALALEMNTFITSLFGKCFTDVFSLMLTI